MVGKKCYLSPMNPNDAEKFTEWLNDLELIVNLQLFDSVIVTDQSLTVRQILDRFANSTIPNIEDNEFYSDDLPNTRNFDYSDFNNIRNNIAGEVERLSGSLSAGRTEQSTQNIDDSSAPTTPVSPVVTHEYCGFLDIDNLNQTAEVGIFIGNKNYWDKGYGTEALNLLLDYGFNALNLYNVMLKVYSCNKRAIRSYEKAGFKQVGIRRKALHRNREKYDILFMDLLVDEFYEKNNAK